MCSYLENRLLHWWVSAFFLTITWGVQAQNEPQNQVGSKILIEGKEYFLHVVKQGQGFYSLARQYNVSQKEILQANPELGAGLKSGQVIKIPVIAGRNSSLRDLAQTGNFILHTVEPGQTVFFISRKYDVPIEAIYENNPGSKNKLVTGSIIKVPVSEPEGSHEGQLQSNDDSFILHEVKPGETLYALSKQYHLSVEQIIGYNPALKNGILSRGSLVRLPKITVDTPPQEVASTSGYIEGEEYLYHEIKPGQTLYSIGRIYQVDIQDLKAANGNIDIDKLKPGYLLRVPKQKKEIPVVQQQIPEADLFVEHKVKRKETLFAISRKYNVDIETLKKVNPETDFSGLRKGETLRIPKDAWFSQRITAPIVAKKEVISSEPENPAILAPNISPDSLCINYERLGRAVPIKVALLLPFSLEASAKANLVSKIENKDTIVTERADKIIANQSKVFVEFYEGALLALDSLKKQGISVELSVYDIAPNRQALNRVLQTPALQKADLIIGPARSDDLGPVSEFSLRHKIKMVYPLSNTNPELWKNPYLFQINTPDTLLFDKMANEIVRQASDQNLLVILPAGEDAYANAFMDKFRKKVYFQEFALNKKIKYKEYRMTRADENLNNLRALLDPIGKNYVVIPTNQEATISEIIPALAGVKEKMKAQVTLFGMTEWLRAQSIDPEDMFALNAQIFTFFALDYESEGTRSFISKYRQWYHTEPHAVSPYFQSSSSTSGFSRYGVWGYDVTYYFVYTMAMKGRNFEYCPAPLEMHPLQFNFAFSRVSNWGGFYNQGLFLLRFNPNYKIIRSPVLFNQPMP